MNKDFRAAESAGGRLASYLNETFAPEDEALVRVRERIRESGLPEIQVGSMDGLHLQVLARAVGARRIVEIGTLGGYSGIHLARALPADGRLYTFELDPKAAEVAKGSFEQAGLADRVRILLGTALENLPSIEKEGPFDLVFIDADKKNYPAYLSWAEKNLRSGGMVIGDNTLAFGMIADESFEDRRDEEIVRALREFNARVAGTGKNRAFRGTLLPTGEGLTVGVRL